MKLRQASQRRKKTNTLCFSGHKEIDLAGCFTAVDRATFKLRMAVKIAQGIDVSFRELSNALSNSQRPGKNKVISNVR